MTSAEFNLWLDDLEVRFPSVSGWFVKVAPEEANRLKVLRSWQVVMGDVVCSFAMMVNLKMQAGDLPGWGEYDSDKERLPQHVRRLARQLAWEAIHGRDEPAEQPPRPSDFPGGKILVRMQQLVNEGMTKEDARDQALLDFPIGVSTREPRYHCHLCLDQQVVEVASPAAVRAMLDGRFAELMHAHRSGVMRCRCDNRQSTPKFRIASYDPQLDFKLQDHLWRQPEVDRFAAWVEFQREHSAEQRAKSHSNYDPALAGFNK